MKDIKIAQIISKNRKEKEITQQELADFIGVSKASVSKWETEQSYPDITILPQLASFFNISIDNLIGYEPQLSKKDIRSIYLQLSNDFSNNPFEETVEKCQRLTQKYFSCYPLLFQIAVLLLNNHNLSDDEERRKKILTQAKSLFQKVKNESDDFELVTQALNMEAVSLMTLGLPNETINLLDESSSLVVSSKALLANAYQMIGNIDKAKETLQIEIYQYLLNLLQLLQSYMSALMDNMEVFSEVGERYLAIAKVFDLKELHPTVILPFYLMTAQGNLANGNHEKALEYLEKYAEIVNSNIYPLKLNGDTFFTLIDNWFDSLVIGTYPPRDEKIIRQSMYEAVASNSIFSVLEDDIQFKNILRKLK